MVYVRKNKKRSMRKLRKGLRRSPRRFNITKPYQTKFVRLTRWSNLDSTNNCHFAIVGSTGGSVTGTTVFRLSNTSGYGEIQNLFDNYCIRRVLYRWVLNRDPVNMSTPGIYPRLTWVHDFNDSTPISRTQMMQHPRLKEFYFGDNTQKTKWYTLKAASLVQLFENTGQVAYKPAWGQFVDTNDYDMAHYGIKYNITELYTGVSVYCEVKLVIDCKGIS